MEATPPDLLRDKLGIMTDAELAGALEVTPSTLATWRGKGDGPLCRKLGKGIFYKYVDVLAWIAEENT